ncbi:MAG TPA: DUF3108 domain-containing protein [Burkholderiaceae bacterium]|nr:DUF3108 domain-containing protein [Burkholderiaceae bacterium]
MPLTLGRPSLGLRAVVALALALVVHFSAWQTLAGIRLLLPRREPSAPMIDVALLPPAQAPIALPARRAVVRATSPRSLSGRGVAPLTAVQPAASAPRATPPPKGAAAEPVAPTPAAAPARTLEKPAPEPAPGARAKPSANPPAPPTSAPDSTVAKAAPTAPPDSTPPPAQPLPPQPPQSSAAAAAAPNPSPTPAQPPAPPQHAPMQVVLPRSARLVYASYATVRAGGFVLPVRGRTTTRWRFQDGHYQLDLNIDVVNFAESSQGQFDPDFGLEPDRYSETHPHKPTSTTRFDWVNRRVSFTDEQRQEKAERGTQDRLSVQFQLSVLRQVYPDLFVRGTVVPITLAGTRDVSHWTFTVTGEDTVDSGLGHLPALRVLSNRTTASGDESLEVWIAEKVNWFPVRIRMVDKNRNMLDFVLDEATID